MMLSQMGTINIRPATPLDIDWLMVQLKQFSEFFDTKMPLYGDGVFQRDAMLNMIQNHIVLVADKESLGPIGFVSGYFTPHIFNPKIQVLLETFWWVSKEHRGSRAGLLLLEAFTDVGKAKANWVLFTLEHNSPVNEKCLIKRGYRFKERSFIMEVS